MSKQVDNEWRSESDLSCEEGGNSASEEEVADMGDQDDLFGSDYFSVNEINAQLAQGDTSMHIFYNPDTAKKCSLWDIVEAYDYNEIDPGTLFYNQNECAYATAEDIVVQHLTYSKWMTGVFSSPEVAGHME
jgi:hypothetical protein